MLGFILLQARVHAKCYCGTKWRTFPLIIVLTSTNNTELHRNQCIVSHMKCINWTIERSH